jgi:hypothetical protein
MREMLAGRDNFANEETLLQYILEDKLDCLCMLMPKCHPDTVGHGIKYTWGYSKLHFHNQFKDAKQKHLKGNMCCHSNASRNSPERLVSTNLSIPFLLHMKTKDTVGVISKALLDHITKQFKQHHSVLDSDYAFIRKA